jgi:acetoin utilization deacetylase AcuC-like enzyme
MLAYSPRGIPVPLPEGHRFPMKKYALLAARLEQADWQVVDAPGFPTAQLSLIHSQTYLDKWRTLSFERHEVRALGFPPSAGLYKRSLHSVGGTLAAARRALKTGFGVNLAGGTHHAFADRGEGFCVFNDVALAVRLLQLEGAITKAVIIDLDVHQGNGTARLFADDNDVFTFSMHGARNYPFRKETSDLDIPLPDNTDDASYLMLLQTHLPDVLNHHRADIAFLLGGVDVLAGDRFGRMALSEAGVVQRDLFVASCCLSTGLPLVYVMAGGYQNDLDKLISAHAASLLALAGVYAGRLSKRVASVRR